MYSTRILYTSVRAYATVVNLRIVTEEGTYVQTDHKEWEQFVQNRVNEIRRLIPSCNRKHCPIVQNPANIPSRGVTPLELQEKSCLRLNGPDRLSISLDNESIDTNMAEEWLPRNESLGPKRMYTQFTRSWWIRGSHQL